MDSELYTSFGKKHLKKHFDLGSKNLSEMVNKDLHSLTRMDFESGYCSEIQSILRLNNSRLFVKAFLKFENAVDKIVRSDIPGFDEKEVAQRLDNMRSKAASLMFRGLLESFDEEEDIASEKLIKAMRIALEEELYFWGKEVFEKN